ncbi:MAG TPA: CBS domain-containing protein [Symbiobacteriaceae bacterium]|nr:CBS domain-containing protein [Symbiobacteriaceae bacterium]
MKLDQLMTRNVRTCSPDSTVQEAARIMSEVNCGAVPVVQGEKLVGMITDRDIVLRCVAKGGDATKGKVSDCMTSDVTTCTTDTDAHTAANLMASKQIRRLPVVENGRLCGIVALGDLATVNIHVNEAGDALSSISEPSRPGAH